MIIKRQMKRRAVLRGMVSGAAVTVGVPFLDCFLNSSGTALASGAQLPTCFGTYFYGLGLTPGLWEPKVVGPNYEMSVETQALSPFKKKMNIFSGMKCFLDSHANEVHSSGVQVSLTGGMAKDRSNNETSLDLLIGDVIGTRTRFRSLEVSSVGAPQTYSRRFNGTASPAETSPAALYARIFGAEFQDPNAATFTPDPQLLARRSSLSGIKEERDALMREVGAEDRVRLDQYFSSLRDLEQQLAVSLQKPEPMAACAVPRAGSDAPMGTVIEDVIANNKLFSSLLANALACGQTQVFNSIFSGAVSHLRRAGSSDTHHVLSHEQAIDEKLGYQPLVHWFNKQCMDGLTALLTALDGVKEGDRTLLDRTLVYATTDTGLARVHGLENFPIFTAGSGNGKLKTGIHYRAPGDAVTRIGLTVQQAMGVPTLSWGAESNTTSRVITDIVA